MICKFYKNHSINFAAIPPVLTEDCYYSLNGLAPAFITLTANL